MSPSHTPDPDHTPAPLGQYTVLRLPPTAYAAILCLFVVLLIPVANWPAYCGWLLLVPICLVWWTARVRTVVAREEVSVRTAFGSRTVPWEQIRGVVFPHPRVIGISWARAHLRSGAVLRLPAVTWNDISTVSLASGGRIPDPLTPRARDSAERIAEDPEQPDDG